MLMNPKEAICPQKIPVIRPVTMIYPALSFETCGALEGPKIMELVEEKPFV